MTGLPTPPGTSHGRDKENRVLGSRVAWSQQNQYFIITNSPKTRGKPPPASKGLPTKSILKHSAQVLLAVPEENQREVTPEPEDPLVNLTYLANPVSQILSPDPTLRELIEAHSILAARIRSAVAGNTDADASWPLFQPLRKNTQALTDAMVRDLGRALVQPTTCDADVEDEASAPRDDEEDIPCLLPSPKSSPKKKKQGMSAAQVKFARDLCTTSHAVMRLLSAVFTLPAVYKVFTEKQLRDMLTQVLAIPLAEELPTPNARKTCALSIWLLQVQRLPEEVLFPAKDRIAYALRRALEGELGKEGKKGSACDGLKAIHDLSIYQPSTFIPAFTELLPSILANLLASTLVLRTQACHALGGFVLGSIALPPSYIHTRISNMVSTFLTTPSTSTSPRKSPSNPSDPVIIRTLRTTLNAVEPAYCAQGPVWALSVLASFIVLLGPAVCTDVQLTRIVSALLQLSMRNKKSSVRGLACLLWRCVAWSYFRSPLVRSSEEEGEDEREDDVDEKEANLARDNFWRLVKSVVDMGAGVSTVAALLADCDDEDRLMKALALVKAMIKKGGQTCGDGMEIVKLFVSFEASEEAWHINKLLPPSLFSASPGLLTADFTSLAASVKPIFEECPQLSDVRSLTREELSKDWVFDEVVDIWRSGIGCLEIPDDSGTPSEIIAIWEGLLKANVATLQDEGDDDSTVEFAVRAASILVDILQDARLDFTTQVRPPSTLNASPPICKTASKRTPLHPRSNAAIKLSITRDLWSIMRTTFPHNLLHAGGAKLLAYLINDEAELVWETDSPDDARKQWAYLSAEVLAVCDVTEMRQFWTKRARAVTQLTYEPGVQGLVWGCFVEKWTEDTDGSWEGAVVLLGVPFIDSNTWELSNDDFETWDKFLNHAMNKALDYGIDASSVLDHVAEIVSRNPCPAFASSTRVADLLLGHLEMPDARQLPSYVFDFVNDTLLSTYPPEPRNKVTSVWLIRSLTRVVDGCPSELCMSLLETLQDGMATWISDDYHVFTEDEYTFDVLPLYQTCLLSMHNLPRSIQDLDTLSSLLESAFVGRNGNPSVASESFEEFWNATYANEAEPEGGWPEKIQACLHPKTPILELCPLDEAIVLDTPPSSHSDLSLSYPSDPVQTESEVPCIQTMAYAEVASSQPSQDEASPSVPRLYPAFFTPTAEAIVSFSRGIPVPSTPTNRPSRPSTPHRPHKPSSTPESYPSLLLRPPAGTLPLTQSPPSTPRRTPVTARSEKGESSVSPSKRRKMEDKENVSPHPVLSVMERMAASSPSKFNPSSVLGKRRSLGEAHESATLKKGRTSSGTFIRSSIDFPSLEESDIEDERAVEASLSFPSPCLFPTGVSAPTSPTSSCQPNISSKKRKRQRVFLDAVELPRLRDIDRQMRMHRRASAEYPPAPITPTKSLRRTSSLPMMGETDSDDLMEGQRKRVKHWDESESGNTATKPFPSSPFRALEEMDVAGSDDSIMLIGPTRRSPPDVSSDDDPLLGQVTPHHLISPAVRRARGFDSDPPSDDSTCPSSPSRDIVARRRRRLLSFSEHRPSPLTV
ncbi:hypothetical protein BV22DRAFT_1132369 [Leucogyrophana mollusca]|uniref:Uncharacterized protein n=1 Tax=Leucogyrophana mollusca TaxID=85980 RepID=A0ACB8B8T6_9AGAM|nr:hypothetical protein BV22DRAFT_1132369 [Leucogyrophana mollusca]